MAGEKKNSRNRLQLVKEATPGVYDSAGDRLMMTSLKGEFQPEEAWASFRPAGFDEDAWHSLERSHRVWTGTVRFDYAQVPTLLRMLCGEPTATDTSGGVVTETFELSNGEERDPVTYTVEYGTVTDCDRCPYGLLVALSGSSERVGDSFEGNITIICQKPTAEGVAMTSPYTNEVQTVTVTTPGSYTLSFDGQVTASFNTAATTGAQLQTKLEALSNIGVGDVAVTGPNDGPYVITFQGALSGTNVATLVSSQPSNMSVATTTPGVARTYPLPARVPIINKNGSARYEDALADLAAATQINRQMMMAFDFGALVDPVFFFDENEDTFQSHVDGAEPTRTFPLRIAEKSTDKAAILNAVNSQPATAFWWEYKWAHPDGDHSLAIQHYSSANAAAPLSAGGNVRAREIPLATVISDEDFSVRIISRVAE